MKTSHIYLHCFLYPPGNVLLCKAMLVRYQLVITFMSCYCCLLSIITSSLLKAGKSLQEYLIYQYILSHLPITCHGVAYGWIRRLVITSIGTMVFIDDKNLINKSGTKTISVK